MQAILEGLKALGAARLAALAGVGLAMLGMLAVLALRGGGPTHYALLYADLETRDAAQIADALDRAHVPHEESPAGDRVMVPAADVARARMLLAKTGLPAGGSIGYEIFDRGDALTASDFQQEVNRTRALEGELARSIRLLDGVRAARVHLVLPKREAFSHTEQAAQASVVLTMAGAARLDAQGVQAVLNLVAAAVPGLKPQAIAVVDSRGAVLARAGQPAPEDQAAETQDEVRRATELRLSRAVEEMLERILGPGHVRAEAAVTMNFERVNETSEAYNPDQQVVRSTQTVTDASRSTEAEKTVSVQNNLPNADAGGAGQSGSQQNRNEETTNYEIGRTVRTLTRAQPEIARISLAVLVDGKVTRGTDGKPVWKERDAAELGRLRTLVQSAVGFDAKRGDTVDVVSMRFAEPEEAAAAPAGLFGLGLEKPDLMALAQSAMLGVVVLMALLFVVRPMALRLAVAEAEESAVGLLGEADGVARIGVAGGAPALPAPAGAEGPETMMEVANVEGQIRASSLRRVAELAEKHPEETVSIVRAWLNAERA